MPAAAQAIQGALHDVVAKTAGAILANMNQVPDILAQLQGIEGMIPGVNSAQPEATVRHGGAGTPVSDDTDKNEV